MRLLGVDPNGSYSAIFAGLLTAGEALLVLVGTYIGARIARTIIRRLAKGISLDSQLILLVGRLSYLFILAVGLLGFVYVIGGPALEGPVLGFLGLLGLAFGLAFQDVLKNWLSGVFLLMERPFRIGDEIKVGELSGTVTTIQLRTTVLQGAKGETILLPNGLVYTSAVVNTTGTMPGGRVRLKLSSARSAGRDAANPR